MSQWISVEERLPEDAKKVLLYGMYQNTYLGQWHSATHVFTEWTGGRLHSITHWMPLPTPPARATDAASTKEAAKL